MKTSDFDYNLPEELIAQTPIKDRDHSRLLVYHKDSKAIEHKHMTCQEAARLAAAADPVPDEMWLTHYSPSMVNPMEYIDSIKKIFPKSIASKDLRTVTLKFKEET